MRLLPEPEFNALVDRILNERVKSVRKENHDEGYDLDYVIDGRTFRVTYDHETYSVFAYEIS